MGPGVGDRIGHIMMRKEDVALALSKSELKDAHAGEIELVAKFDYVRSDQPKVFCNDGKIREYLCKGFKQLFTRAGHPLAADCIGRIRRYFPVRRKATKMIDANHVCQLQAHDRDVRPTRHNRSFRGFPNDIADFPRIARLR